MPALNNLKHENFCQLTLQGAKYGWSQSEIYKRSGYHATGHSAEMAASRLMKKDEIRQRIAELNAPAARKTATTVQSLIAELELARAAAHDDKQFSASVQAIAGKAKLSGLDNRENGNGSGGEFSECKDIPAVVAQLLTEQSPAEALEICALMQQEIERQASDRASIVPDAPGPHRESNEAERSLQLFRPRYRAR